MRADDRGVGFLKEEEEEWRGDWSDSGDDTATFGDRGEGGAGTLNPSAGDWRRGVWKRGGLEREVAEETLADWGVSHTESATVKIHTLSNWTCMTTPPPVMLYDWRGVPELGGI